MDAHGAGAGTVQGDKLGITLAAMGGAFMAILDISIVNVALSDIRASFGAPLDRVAWVSTSYMMANVVVIPMTGWLQRRFGYRRCLATALLLFSLASALCGTAWDLPSLLAFRVLQGVGGGAIIPTAQSLLMARYPRREHGLAGALFGLGALTGPLLGPSLGGALIDAVSWPAIFLVNVPIGILAAGLALRHIVEPGRGTGPRDPIDGAGIALLAVAMAGAQYVLEEGNREDWFASGKITAAAAAAAVALSTFVVHELETPHPIVDLRVFRRLAYAAATGLNFLVGLAAFSAAYLFSLYCGAAMGYAAVDIGRVFLAAGAIQFVLLPVLGVWGGRVDGRLLILVGIGATAAGLLLHARLSPLMGFADLVRPRFVLAVGLAFLYVPLSVLALSGLPDADRGGAAGLFNLTRELGGSVGTAWMSLLLVRRGAHHGARLGEAAGLQPALLLDERLGALHQSLAGAGAGADATTGGAALLREGAAAQVLVLAFNDAFLLCALVFSAGVLLVPLLRRPGAAG